LIRTLVVDAQALVRRGLTKILRDLREGVEFGEAGTAAEAMSLASGERWDVVLLDLGLPDRHGLEVLRELHATRPQLPVLILTMFPEDQLALRMLELGASGYLTKESAPEELLRALERVMAGHKYLSPAMAQAVADGLGGPPPPPPGPLSDPGLGVPRPVAPRPAPTANTRPLRPFPQTLP